MPGKSWGTIRKVLLDLASDFVEVNEDLERVSVLKTRQAIDSGIDLFPRGYVYPQADLTIRCRAARQNGKIKLFGLKEESHTNSIEVTIQATIQVKPLNRDELEVISAQTEAEIDEKLRERGIEDTNPGHSIPDEDEPL